MKKIIVTLSEEAGMELTIEEIESPMEAMWLLEVARDEIKAQVARKPE
jgi:EAL domain-containing protein (putative c-di-GMP-specific phosphodiesterase class I)